MRLGLLSRGFHFVGSINTRYRSGTTTRVLRLFVNKGRACANAGAALLNERDGLSLGINCCYGSRRLLSVGCITRRVNGGAIDSVGTKNILESGTRGLFHNAVSFPLNSSNTGNSRGRSILVLNRSIVGRAMPLVLYTRRSIRNGRNTSVNEPSSSILFCLTDENLSRRRTYGLVTHTGLSTLYSGVNSRRLRALTGSYLRRIANCTGRGLWKEFSTFTEGSYDLSQRYHGYSGA